MPVDAIEELQKTLESWEKQKQEKLKDARICDAYISATSAALQLLEKDPNYKKQTKDNS